MDGSFKAVDSWLPTEFNKTEFDSAYKYGLNFPSEFPYEFDSFGSSSPDESVVGSTETESSEDDDFLAGLTRRLTQKLAVKPEKKWVMAGSPESTLSGIGSWSVSSIGSPNAVLSPPTTPFGAKNDTWDLIYAAAGQVARLKMNNEANKFNYYNSLGKGILGPVRTQNPDTVLKNKNIGLFLNQTPAPQLNQYRSQVRNEQMLKPQVKVCWQAQPQPQPQAQSHYQQQIQSRNRVSAAACYENGGSVRPLGLPQCAWPPLQVPTNQPPPPPPPQKQQQHSGSGAKDVFLGGSGVKKERAGTGVFFPRRYGNPTPTESRKKTACSTALLPPRVIQALNLNLEDFNSPYDAMMARRNVVLAQQQKRILRHENVLNLPQEWTY